MNLLFCAFAFRDVERDADHAVSTPVAVANRFAHDKQPADTFRRMADAKLKTQISGARDGMFDGTIRAGAIVGVDGGEPLFIGGTHRFVQAAELVILP